MIVISEGCNVKLQKQTNKDKCNPVSILGAANFKKSADMQSCIRVIKIC